MSDKHTPAPWTACSNGACICGMVNGGNQLVCTVKRGPWGDEFPSLRIVGQGLDKRVEAFMDLHEYGRVGTEESMANARLIAAAPQLKEALEMFMECWNSRMNGSSSKKAQQFRADMWDKANAAIEKAKGQP